MAAENLKEKEKGNIVIVKKMLVQKEVEETNQYLILLPQMLVLFVVLASSYRIFSSAFSIQAMHGMVYGILLIYTVGISLCYGSRLEHKVKCRILLGVLGGSLLMLLLTLSYASESFFSLVYDILQQINYNYNGNLKLFEKPGADATYALMLHFLWTALFLGEGIIENQKYYHILFFCFPIVTASLISGGTVPVAALFFLFLSLFIVIASASTNMRRKFWGGDNKEEFFKNRNASRRIRNYLSLLSAVTGTVLMIAAYFVFAPAIMTPMNQLSNVVSPIKTGTLQVLYKILPNISEGKLSFTLEGAGGGVSDGELGAIAGLAYDQEEALKITCSTAPGEIIYLKGFIGTEYTGSGWEAREEGVFENAVQNWHVENDSVIYIQNLPFLRMMYAEQELVKKTGDSISTPNQITVEKLSTNEAYTYVPYQAFLNDYYVINGGDCSIQGQKIQDDVYAWYSVKSYKKIMQQWKEEENHSVLDDIETSYASYVQQEDTKVDKEQLSELWELCREKKESWDQKLSGELTKEQQIVLEEERYTDIKSFIVSTLWENCTFTTEVWKLPKGKDFVTCFWTEQKRGDSTAFASTAALMYRMFDIPARYVVGYAAPENLFFTTADGQCSAVLQNDNAHAWVEIYMSDIGWVPVETTPGFTGTVSNMEVQEEDLPEETAQEEKQQEKTKQNSEGFLAAIASLKGILIAIAIVLLDVLLLTWRYRHLHKKRRGQCKNYTKEQQIKVIFHSLYDLLLFMGFPKEVDTTEYEFVEQIKMWYDEMEWIELTEYMKLVLETHYGKIELMSKDVEFSIKVYEKLVKLSKERIKGKRKLIFCLWKAF